MDKRLIRKSESPEVTAKSRRSQDSHHVNHCHLELPMRNRGSKSVSGLSPSNLLAFLIPLITAIAAGVIVDASVSKSDESSIGQIIGSFGGLIIGILLVWRVIPFFRKHFHHQHSM